MANRNEFTKEELQTILNTMEAFPEHATSLTIELRPQQATGRIEKNTDDKLVFIPTHFTPPSTSWRD